MAEGRRLLQMECSLWSHSGKGCCYSQDPKARTILLLDLDFKGRSQARVTQMRRANGPN